MTSRRRGFLYVTGALLLLGPPSLWVMSSYSSEAAPPLEARPRAVTTDTQAELASHTAMLKRDPLELMELGQQRYQEKIDAYRCVLVKQERVNGKLTETQEVEVRYREEPRAVYMLWKANADQARRALYMPQDERFIDDKGRKLVRVEPNGAIARLFVKDIFVQADGAQARKSSRRTIDECGFGALFKLFEEYNRLAEDRGVLNLRYAGTGEVDGRPTHVIVRDLPYEGPDGPYPDARMVLHLDQEWLLPVAVYSYADHAETELLGKYLYTKVDLNPEFGQDDFEF